MPSAVAIAMNVSHTLQSSVAQCCREDTPRCFLVWHVEKPTDNK